jgi:membrane protein YdbS with pleckstrin-like domain
LILEKEQVFPENMPTISEAVFTPVDKRYLYVIFISAGIVFGILFVGLILWLAFSGNWRTLWIVGLSFGSWTFLLLLRGIAAYMHYKRYGYAIRQHDIIFKSGWLFKRWIIVPFNRVQHVEIKKSPIEDLFDLSRLKIFTAGGSGSDATIPGLGHEEAGKLKDYIMNTIGLDEEE